MSTPLANLPPPKLSPADVVEIRRFARMGLPRKVIMSRYPVGKTALAKAIRGESWREIES